MIEALLSHDVSPEKIVADCSCVTLNASYQNLSVMQEIMDDLTMTGGLAWNFILPYRDYDGADYVRFSTLYYVARQLKHFGVSGALAEVGVFRGEFSRRMNELFPDRNIYLFDTFESFPEQDINSGLTEKDNMIINQLLPSFKDTSVDIVLKKMPYPNRCFICKGLFPDTLDLVPKEEVFSLVSLDTDLYPSIRDGLECFYPRMTVGGMILVHDYGLDGVKKAVDEFSRNNSLIPVPVADSFQSIILTKS